MGWVINFEKMCIISRSYLMFMWKMTKFLQAFSEESFVMAWQIHGWTDGCMRQIPIFLSGGNGRGIKHIGPGTNSIFYVSSLYITKHYTGDQINCRNSHVLGTIKRYRSNHVNQFNFGREPNFALHLFKGPVPGSPNLFVKTLLPFLAIVQLK